MSNEKLVNEALHVALGEVNATSSIQKFLEKLGTSMHCDRIYIFEGKNNHRSDTDLFFYRFAGDPLG